MSKSTEPGEARIYGGVDGWEYSFPEIRIVNPVHSTKHLLMMLERLIKSDESYFDIRTRYCRIQIELNKRFNDSTEGIKSPKFRIKKMLPPVSNGHSYEVDDIFLSNDTQIIAMHWHHCRNRRWGNDALTNRVYCNEAFDFKSAAEFVVTRGYASKKVDMIGLSLDERWESGSFDNDDMRTQAKKIDTYVKNAKNRLNIRARRYPQIKNSLDAWCDLLQAMLIETICNESDRTILPSQVAIKYKTITGKTMSRQAVNSKIISISKHIDDWQTAVT